MRMLLVASTGGHLTQLLLLEDLWRKHERHWVTFEKQDAVSSLAGETVSWAHHPTTRNLPNAWRNLRLAHRVVDRFRPDVVISSGAGVAFPFFLVARSRRVRTVYVEVFDRIEHPTLTGSLCYPLTDLFALQWLEQKRQYPDGKVIGWLV